MAAKRKIRTKKASATKKPVAAKKRVAATKPAAKTVATTKPNRTFAVRVTDQELEAIHRAAGPRNATRFARAILAAFASGDSKAFGQVLDEAGKARS